MFSRLKPKLALGARDFRLMGLALRLVQREDGAAAVEFALVAAPFLALLFAIIETSLVFFAGQALETQTANATRLILTGQQQSASIPANSSAAAEFAKKVCDPSTNITMFDCSKMIIDVQTIATFSAANTSKPIVAGQLDPNFTATYNPGGPNCIVVARVMYQWPIYVSLFTSVLSSISLNLGDTGKTRLLMATSVFRNEPYGPSAC